MKEGELHIRVFTTGGPDPREMGNRLLLFSIRILPEFHSGLKTTFLSTTPKEIHSLKLSTPAVPQLHQPTVFFHDFAYLMLEILLIL